METGFGRNLLAELLDSVGRGVLLMALGIGWFVFLWGLNLPALLAGIALGTLLLLLRRLYRQTTLVRRETALRCRIGGELLLEKMLLSEAKEAAHYVRRRAVQTGKAVGRRGNAAGAVRSDAARRGAVYRTAGGGTPGDAAAAGESGHHVRAGKSAATGDCTRRADADAHPRHSPRDAAGAGGAAFPRDGCAIGGAGTAKTENAAARQPAVYHDAAGKSTTLLGLRVVHADTLYPHWQRMVRHAGDGLPDAVGRLPFRSGGGGAAIITSAAQSP